MGTRYLPFKFYTALSPPNNEISMYEKPKSSSKSNSAPTLNLGAVHLKTYAQVTYDIQIGSSWTPCKDKDLIFQTGLISYPTKI
jgi:hypothetical protein